MKTPDRRDADAPRPRPLSSSSSWSPAPCGACPRRPTTSAARSPRRRIPCSTRSTSVPPNSCNTWRMPRGTTTPPPPATPSPPRNGGSASAAPSAGCGASATRRGTGIPRVPRHGVACCRRRGDRALPPASPVLLRLPPCASPSTVRFGSVLSPHLIADVSMYTCNSIYFHIFHSEGGLPRYLPLRRVVPPAHLRHTRHGVALHIFPVRGVLSR